jgi:hypothetical protein
MMVCVKTKMKMAISRIFARMTVQTFRMSVEYVMDLGFQKISAIVPQPYTKMH